MLPETCNFINFCFWCCKTDDTEVYLYLNHLQSHCPDEISNLSGTQVTVKIGNSEPVPAHFNQIGTRLAPAALFEDATTFSLLDIQELRLKSNFTAVAKFANKEFDISTTLGEKGDKSDKPSNDKEGGSSTTVEIIFTSLTNFHALYTVIMQTFKFKKESPKIVKL